MNISFKFSISTVKKMSEHCQKRSWWTKYSESKLIEVENSILSVVKTTFKTWFVPIGSTVGEEDKIWTISLNEELKTTPLVMLHGFAAGLGFWCKNFDDIAKDRPVYAIDLLGFGRSSRPTFAKDCETAEQQFVTAIEEWRKQVNLDKFVLLGHSFGGYLATSYTINHPERVKHLILADPWGFAEKNPNLKPPMFLKVLRVILFPFTYFNPLAAVRAAGPFGPALVKKLRGDIARRFEDSFEDTDVITEYIYQCNSQNPSGETAFHSFLKGFAWSKNPMVRRYDAIAKDVPITFIFGEESWIDKTPGAILQEKRGNVSYVNIGIIPCAGHHLYSDQPEIFNKLVTETCRIADTNLDRTNFIATLKIIKEDFDHEKIKEFIKERSQDRELTEEEIKENIKLQEQEREVTVH